MKNPNELDNNKIYYQPCLFTDGSEMSTLRNDCNGLLSKLNNLRRGVFKRLDDVVKSIKELFLRQDEQALEMQRLKNKLNELEESLRQSSYRSSSNERTLHIVGRKPNVKPLYMMGK